jgi:hypothetical protein
MEREDKNEELEREQEALSRAEPEGLIGDTAQNRNLSGSSTWETIGQEHEEDESTESSGPGGGDQ